MWRRRPRIPPSESRRRPRAGWLRAPESTSTRLSGRPASSASPVADRSHDIVVFGATGFTGALTAEYLARNAPSQTRWALAGRNMDKLGQVRARLGAGSEDVPLLRADVTDEGS